ncbi:MAG TPA: WXG100 family type VII secretion target [Natronosporangium sp.]
MFKPVKLLDGPMTYQFPQLVQASEDINNACRIMMEKLDTLNKSLDVKLADWGGNSRGSYQDLKNQWNTAAENIQGLLQAVSRAVYESSERMAAQELRNAQRFMR